METYSIKAVLSADDKGFTAKMKAASDSLSRMEAGSQKTSRSIMDIAKGVGVFKALAAAGEVLKASLGSAIDRFDTMKRFPKVMEQMGFSAETSNKSIQKLSDGIQGLPTSLDGITASTQRIAVLTGDLDKAADTSLALNNAFLASGAVTADAERGLTQYVQMLSKGTVDMQSWRTLQETMGYALRETAVQLGVTSGDSLELYEALQSGEITFGQFNDALIECSTKTGGFAEKAKEASGGIKTSFTNLGIAVVRGMANTVDSVDSTMERLNGSTIDGTINNLSDKIDTFFEGVAGGAETAVQGIHVVAQGVQMLAPVLKVGAAGFLAFKTAMSVQDKVQQLRQEMAGAKPVIDAFSSAQRLAAEAARAEEIAVGAQARAEEKGALASRAAAAAEESETLARISSAEAVKARSAADKAAGAEVKVRAAEEAYAAKVTALRSREEALAAASTKSRAAQERAAAAVTKAKEAVDKRAAMLEAAKANAAKLGAASAELNAKAEVMEAAAAKAQSKANTDAVKASAAKATAEAAESRVSALNAAAETKNAAAVEASNIVQAKSSMLVIAKTAALGVLAGEMGIVEAAQWAWNAAVAANPVGAAVMAVTAYIAVLAGVVKALQRLDTEKQKDIEKTKELVSRSETLVESIESSGESYKNQISDIKAAAGANQELADKISELSAKEKKSEHDKAALKSYVDALNSSMEGLNLQYDGEADALNMSKEALMEKVEAYKAEAEAQAAQERYIEVKKEQLKIDEELNRIAQRKGELEENYQKEVGLAPAAVGQYNEATEELCQTEKELNDKKKELTESEKLLEDVMAESQQSQAEAVSASVESQKFSMEDLSESQQKAVQDLNETWQSYADHTTDMFDTLSDKSELSVADMTANLQENQRVVSEWSSNIAALAQRGLDEGLLEQLRQAGPESAGYVNAMVQASDAELQQLSEAFSNGGQTATDALKTAFDTSSIPESVMGMVTKTQETLSSQIEAADFASLGKNMTSGITQGIVDGTQEAETAGASASTDIREAAGAAVGEGSPCTSFIELGGNMMDGIVIGVQRKQEVLNSAMRKSMGSAGRVAVNAMNSSMKNISSINTSAFTRISAAARDGMGQMTSAVTAGTSKSSSAMQAGMRAMNVSTQTGMRAVLASADSGMNRLRQSIDNGMNQSRGSVARGVSGMVSALSPLQPRFYSSGYYASMGLANGINAGAGAAISAAKRLADTVARTMEKALDINSPSKVTTKIGEYAGIGPAIGLMNMLPKVEKASDKIAAAMVPGWISDYTDRIHADYHAGSYMAAAGDSAAPLNQNSLIEGLADAISNLNIQVQAVLSARDIGNASTEYVDRNIGTRTAVRERYGCV